MTSTRPTGPEPSSSTEENALSSSALGLSEDEQWVSQLRQVLQSIDPAPVAVREFARQVYRWPWTLGSSSFSARDFDEPDSGVHPAD